ncbi:MAG: hypothetical protein NZV14_08390 [Bryobacteraceae bacterium]|nr:hypothetical protein [Bryobacteraceae bacterium]MDW8378166.1 hypothetical protein [Bryobacterales bacterium]
MRKALLVVVVFSGLSFGQRGLVDSILQLEGKGERAEAREALQRALKERPKDPATLLAWAEFLDRISDPGVVPAYEAALAAIADNPRKAAIARRLVTLDLLKGDRASAQRHLEVYQRAGGTGLSLPAPDAPVGPPMSVIEIPGPLRSFARMAALSPDLAPEELLTALARNVVTNGYQAASSSEALDQTEYLKLVIKYLSQARELTKLAGESKTIRIDSCESAQTADLLRILGYRMRGGCGAEVVLETVNASRAFLTIDSGFPLAELEQALRTNRSFVYDYHPTKVPVLYTPDYWLTAKEKQSGEFIDAFLADPSLCRLYLGLSKLDVATAEELRKAVPVQRIRAFSHVLDFFGAMIEIRDGKVSVPGGARTAQAWAELVGAPPDQGAAFIEKLISRDDGWLASYFDSLSRISGPLLDYLTEPERMKRFYWALRGRITSPGPARPVFRANTELMLLTTRMRLEADGKPHIPGGIEVWKNLFVNHPHGKYDGKLTKSALTWKEPDDVIEALFALSRKAVENEPLKIYMALTDINRRREKPLEPATVDRLAREFRTMGAQYPIFAEFPSLSDKTILQYLDIAKAVSDVKDQSLRADVAGSLQGLISLWQIFARHDLIPKAQTDPTLSTLLSSFSKVRNSRELFDASRAGVELLLKQTGSPADANPADRIFDLLAGTTNPPDAETHRQIVQDMVRLYELQRLPSLKLLFDVADHLEALGKGEKMNTALLNRLNARISEIVIPRSALSTVEKNSLAFGYWTERHIEGERKLNIRSQVERAGADPEKLRDIRGQLAPLLRDALVGLSYVHYAPPGAQILQTNPIFVRSHDFLGLQGTAQTWRATEVFGTGWPSNAGGRLVGSLSNLPYALAEAEQNFLIPTREQALIWGDLVPQMILSAKVPRWWNVQPAHIHYVGLQMRRGESLLAESVVDANLRTQVVRSLERHAPPARARKVEHFLAAGLLPQAIEHVTPSEMFLVGVDLLRSQQGPFRGAIQALEAMGATPASISRAFGTPKPTLAHSYYPELLHLRTFPTLMGYSSRIMAESWESNLLYFAALADELNLSPSQLNVLIPEWTQKTVEGIFATHLEDWPALLRSLRNVGTMAKKSGSENRTNE